MYYIHMFQNHYLFFVFRDNRCLAPIIKLPELSQEEKICAKQNNPEKITNLQLNLTDQLLVVGTNYNQLYYCCLTDADVQKDLKTKFRFLIYSFSSSEIRRIDTAVWKSLIAACSIDRIFLWNYQNSACELKKVFYEEACCIAIHPFGLFLIVGFTNHFDVYIIRLDDLTMIKQFATTGACNQCAFSQSGHMFAVAEGNLIIIYYTLTFEKFVELRGHNGKITAIAWCKEDCMLFSCSEDGALYEWNIFSGVRENENVWKKCSYLSVTADPSGGTGYVIGNDQTIKEIANSIMIHSLDTKTQLTDLTLSGKNNILFGGTEKGYVQALRYPLTENFRWDKYVAHNSKITQVKLTNDDLWLITSSEEGSIFIWKLCDRDDRILTEEQHFLSGDVIMKIDDLKLKMESIAHLERQLSDVQRTNEYQIYIKQSYHIQMYREQAEKYTKEIEELVSKLEDLKSQNTALTTKHKDDIGDLQMKHLAEINERDQQFRKKLKREYNSYEKLKSDKDLMQADYETKLKELKKEHEEQLAILKTSYEEHLKELQDKLNKAIVDHENTKHNMEEMRISMERDADNEILVIKVSYEEELQNERNQNSHLNGEIDMMKGKIAALKDDIQKNQKQIENKNKEEEMLKVHIKNLGRSIENLKRVIKEREETILEKEKCTHDLRKHKQQLEKLNFMLSSNTQENESKLGPIQEENNRLRNQMKDMEEKLVRFQQSNKNLRCLLKSVRLQMKGIENERMKEQNKAQQVYVKLIRYRQDLSKLVTNIQNPTKLKISVINLYRQHIEKAEVINAEMDDEKIDEYQRHIEYLEDTMTALKEKMERELSTQHRNYERLIQEHSDMIQEINSNRKELLAARNNMRKLDFAFGVSTGETTDVKEKVDQILKIEKDQKKLLKDIETRDKIILLQSQKIRRFHAQVTSNVAEYHDDGSVSEELSPMKSLTDKKLSEYSIIHQEEAGTNLEFLSKTELKSKEISANVDKSVVEINNQKHKFSQTSIKQQDNDLSQKYSKDIKSEYAKIDIHDHIKKQSEKESPVKLEDNIKGISKNILTETNEEYIDFLSSDIYDFESDYSKLSDVSDDSRKFRRNCDK
ncbi:cilia- and flagella-associated protein 57-like isoform X2 [Centruroides sculpturatus]|uniref:cilia- and flagella-associated protein 57-like isoform X2 n=1 Tax=Centruroides sculpturatus TaxID=218467 RepID=UPI000C6E18B6|nr:cilia- and flagella-associated protein 57-like isoform X2 [Centruroides sculpturatus]